MKHFSSRSWGWSRTTGATLASAVVGLWLGLQPGIALSSPGEAAPTAVQPSALESAPEPPAPPPEPASGPPKPESPPEPASRLVPRSEPERMGPHPVAFETMRFEPGDGLRVESRDERFRLDLRLRLQLRYSFANDNGEGTQEHGLQIRRARAVFGGFVFGKHNRYKLELAVSPQDQGFEGGVPHTTPLLDWYVHFDHLRDLQLRAGQYKVPFNRQRVISSGDLQLVDRALANGEFTLDRDVGLDLRSSDFLGLDRLRYYAGVYMGEGRDTFKAKNFDMMYIGRVEFLPFGMFEDYKEADFERSKRPNISLGGAYAFLDGAQRNRGILGDVPTDGGATDYHNVTADFVLKMLGLSVTGEFFYRKGYRDYGEATVPDAVGAEVPAPRELPRTGIGWFLQGGFLIPRIPFEIAGRYSEVRPFDTSSLRERHEAGGGVGYYFAQHSLKLQLDYFRNWFDADLVRGTDEVRLQLQLAY